MASIDGERPRAWLCWREDSRSRQRDRHVITLYGRRGRHGSCVCPPRMIIYALASSKLMLLLWIPSYITLCLCARLRDISASATATTEQPRHEEAVLLDANPSTLSAQRQPSALNTIVDVSKTSFPRDSRWAATTAISAGRTVNRVLAAEATTGDAVRETAKERFAAPAASIAGSVTIIAESCTRAAEGAGNESRRLLPESPWMPTAFRTAVARMSPAQADADLDTLATASFVLGYVFLTVGPQGNDVVSSESGLRRQRDFARTACVCALAQRLQERNVRLSKRFTGGLPRRLAGETRARVGVEAAESEAALSEGPSLLRKFDDLLGDVVEYRQLRRKRDFNKVAEAYADEDVIPEEEVSILEDAREDLKKLRDRKRVWTTVMLPCFFVSVSALFWLYTLSSPTGPSGRPLNYEELRHRQIEFRIVSAVTLGILLGAFYGYWRRRVYNRKIHLQELEIDRITFEAIAGVRPTKKNVLGPSKRDIEKHQRLLKKKADAEENRS